MRKQHFGIFVFQKLLIVTVTDYAADRFIERSLMLWISEAIDKDKIKRKLTKYVAWRRYYKRTIAAGGKPYKKSQFFKLYKLYFKRYDYKFETKPVLKEVKEYSMAMKIVSHNRRAVVIMREEIEKFCKKLRLRPEGIL